MNSNKKRYRVKRLVEEWYEVMAYSKKEAEMTPKESPYAVIIVSEKAKLA